MNQKTNKSVIIEALDVEGGYFLPPARMLTKNFLKQFFKGQKKLLWKNEIKEIGGVRNYKELNKCDLFDNFPLK